MNIIFRSQICVLHTRYVWNLPFYFSPIVSFEVFEEFDNVNRITDYDSGSSKLNEANTA